MIGSPGKDTIKNTLKHIVDEDVTTPPVQHGFFKLLSGDYFKKLNHDFLELLDI